MLRRGLILVLWLMIASASFSQTGEKYWGIDFGVGAATPLHAETRKTLTFAWNTSLGVDIPFLQFDKLRLRPSAGLKWYMKEIAEENSVSENFRTIKAGLQAEYEWFSTKTIQFSPLLRIDYNWSRNYFSQTTYNPWDDFGTTTNSDYYLKGTGVSADLGLKATLRNIYIQLHYEFYQPKLNVNPTFVQEAKDQGFIIPSSQTYKFSSINLTFGTNIKWYL